MLHCFSSTWSLIRVKDEALGDEVKEQLIVRRDCLFESTALWRSQDTILGIFNKERRVICVEIVVLLTTQIYHLLREHPAELHYVLKLLLLVVTWE